MSIKTYSRRLRGVRLIPCVSSIGDQPLKGRELSVDCESAFNIDPQSASNADPLKLAPEFLVIFLVS